MSVKDNQPDIPEKFKSDPLKGSLSNNDVLKELWKKLEKETPTPRCVHGTTPIEACNFCGPYLKK